MKLKEFHYQALYLYLPIFCTEISPFKITKELELHFTYQKNSIKKNI